MILLNLINNIHAFVLKLFNWRGKGANRKNGRRKRELKGASPSLAAI